MTEVAEVDGLVLGNLGLAYSLVQKHISWTSFFWHDDLRSAALEGLVRAARDFDPDLGYSFTTFASPRIRGAIIDEYRRVISGRSVGGRRSPHDRRSDVSLDAPTGGADSDVPLGRLADQGAPDPAECAVTSLDARRVIAALSPLESKIVRWHYYEDLPQAQIARRLGISETGVSHRLTEMRRRMRRTVLADWDRQAPMSSPVERTTCRGR